MSLEHIRLATQAREQLIKLKRITGIKNWNVLCRWALCVSLADSSSPIEKEINADSSVEMSWKVFGGEYQGIYLALLRQRCRQDGLDVSPQTMSNQLKLHLHRGVAILAGDRSLRDIESLFGRIS